MNYSATVGGMDFTGQYNFYPGAPALCAAGTGEVQIPREYPSVELLTVFFYTHDVTGDIPEKLYKRIQERVLEEL